MRGLSQVVLKKKKRRSNLVMGLPHMKLVLKEEQQFGEGAISRKVGLKRGIAFDEGAV